MKKSVYGAIQLTGGCLLTIPGLIFAACCLLFMDGKVHKNGYSYIIEVGNDGGGLNLGALSFCGSYSETNPKWFEHTRRHEFGHSLQNIIFGPLQIFIVSIPSAIRYGYQTIAMGNGKTFPADWYDSVGFEKTATDGGTIGIDTLEQ